MSLKKADRDKIAAILKLDAKIFNDAYDAPEEKDIVIPELIVLTAEEQTARDAAQQALGKREGSSEGKDVGKELVVKDLKKLFGVEFDGKDLTKLTESIKAQLAKGDEGLKEQVKLLQANLAQKDTELSNFKAEAETARNDAGLLAMLPKGRISTFTDSEFLTLMKTSLKFEHQDGKTVVMKDGQIMRDDKTTNPLPTSDAINAYFTERKWIEPAQQQVNGRGGQSKPATGRAMRMSEAVKEWEDQKKNPVSAEFNAHIEQLSKENDNFDFYS